MRRDLEVRTLFEDAACLVLDKPSGLAVHRGLSRDEDTLVDRILAARGGPVHLVNRLDRGTSGAIVVATSAASAAELGATFAGSDLTKIYLALVRGSPPEDALVDHPIPRDEGGPRVAAVTRIRRLSVATLEGSLLREVRYALVEATPRTGRFHQVRRHCKHLGHPIVGDTTYGRSEHNALLADRVGLERLALHAARIAFDSPAGGRVDVSCPLPPDLAGPLERLGLLAAGVDLLAVPPGTGTPDVRREC